MNEHEDIETLAALAEGTLAGEPAARVRDHLASCRSCMSAYVDAVRYRAAWLAQPSAFAPTKANSGELAGAMRIVLGDRQHTPAWFIAAATLVVLVGGAAVLARLGETPASRLALPPAVRTTTERLSSNGLVLPGGVAGAARPAPATRSGMGETSIELEQEANAAIATYEHGHDSAEQAMRVVAALIATGDLDAARDYAREGLRRHPGDVRLLVLQAGVFDRDDDLARALAALREAHRRAPDDPVVTLDLALVLRQGGASAEAKALLERVAKSAVPALAERAARELRAE